MIEFVKEYPVKLAINTKIVLVKTKIEIAPIPALNGVFAVIHLN